MGFCYLNSIAIAALEARATGFDRVAVFDFDVHHGNGTEAILHQRPGCAFFSIHQFPAYPGTGRRHQDNCFNYTVPPGLSRSAYRDVAVQALDDLHAFEPQLVAVSAGFDAYSGDPLCQQQLEVEDFHWFGTRFREMGVPVFSVLEGGYSDSLPELILAYLLGLQGHAHEPAPFPLPEPEREFRTPADRQQRQ
jgi:acetoin utilization deacetylase AcuC-like enzyme